MLFYSTLTFIFIYASVCSRVYVNNRIIRQIMKYNDTDIDDSGWIDRQKQKEMDLYLSLHEVKFLQSSGDPTYVDGRSRRFCSVTLVNAADFSVYALTLNFSAIRRYCLGYGSPRKQAKILLLLLLFDYEKCWFVDIYY